LIKCYGEKIINNIIKRINKSKIYIIIFDETTDLLYYYTLILQYFHYGIICEDFLQFIDLRKEVLYETDVSNNPNC
jgi:hypothetical protein